ncbi:MAG: hypothetical protein JWM39_869 [Parcubacteria group bacterium]|nr:hypothetical protein [Parcubacteria group bacterium]
MRTDRGKVVDIRGYRAPRLIHGYDLVSVLAFILVGGWLLYALIASISLGSPKHVPREAMPTASDTIRGLDSTLINQYQSPPRYR